MSLAPLRRHRPVATSIAHFVVGVLPLIFFLACTVVLLLSLVGCGGGEDTDDRTDGRKTIQPVDCKTHPELCK